MTLKDLVAACGEAARFFKPYQVGWCNDLRERAALPRWVWCLQALCEQPMQQSTAGST